MTISYRKQHVDSPLNVLLGLLNIQNGDIDVNTSPPLSAGLYNLTTPYGVYRPCSETAGHGTQTRVFTHHSERGPVGFVVIYNLSMRVVGLKRTQPLNWYFFIQKQFLCG